MKDGINYTHFTLSSQLTPAIVLLYLFPSQITFTKEYSPTIYYLHFFNFQQINLATILATSHHFISMTLA